MKTMDAPEISPRERKLYEAAYYQAARLGLKREDAQDCSIEFVERMLAVLRQAKNTPPDSRYEAWLHRCARNHAINFMRALSRHTRREMAMTDRAQNAPMLGPGPKTLALRKELWRQVGLALEELSPAQQELFAQYHLRSVSIAELSSQTGRSPHAIEQSLSNIRKRLAGMLTSQGWSNIEVQTLFRSGVSSRPRVTKTEQDSR